MANIIKCLVTGAAGFIGSSVVDELVKIGHKVIAIDDESANNEIFFWNKKAENYKLSICEYEAIVPLFKNIDYVFHIAAESRIANSIENPLKTYNTNIIGTHNVLKSALINKVSRVVFSSTSSIYGLNSPPNLESDKDNCLNPYSISKLAAENICKFFLNSYNLPVTILRYFNVFGDRAPSNGLYAPVTSIFLKQYKEKKSLTVVGNGKNKRDFIHINDVVKANLDFCFFEQKKTFNDVFNVGSSKSISILRLAKLISKNIEFIPARIGEAKTTLANIKKINSIIDWLPSISVENWIKKKVSS